MADDRPVSPADGGERLDSWKEIASYLKRSVRSVQRWEAEEGMPVHRHLHDKRGTIYAFRSEIDAWWKVRGSILADRNGEEEAAVQAPQAPAVESPRRRSGTAALVAAGFALAMLVAGLLAWRSRNGSGSSGAPMPLAFSARDWVLVTSFDNRTGESLFDGTLEYALTRELANSRYVNVVPRERVEDALRLMRKPTDTRIDPALGREVCLRDGGIRALLTGRVERIGQRYVFNVEIAEPKAGTTLVGFTEETPDRDGSPEAFRRIANRIRKGLGETQTPGMKPELLRVTTWSLKALYLFSQADALLRRHQPAAAEELLKQAVTEDPTFGSAYVHLAWAIENQRRPPEEYRPYLETALRLSDKTSDPERYFIRASYHDLLGQKEKAAAAYEALIALSPDHPWAWGNLGWMYVYPRDIVKIVALEKRWAALRPHDLFANLSSAINFLVWLEDPVRAEPYLRRVREIVAQQGYTEETYFAAGWLEILPAAQRWLASDVAGTRKELDELASRLGEFSILGARERVACRIGNWYLTLGLLDEAERLYRTITDPVVQAELLAQVSLVRGETPRTREMIALRGDKPIFYPTTGATAVLLARSPRARPLNPWWFERAGKRGLALWRVEVLRGELAMSRGDRSEGVSLLENATTDQIYNGGEDYFQLGLESLTAARERSGETARAIDRLERNARSRYKAAYELGAPYWMRNQYRLARLYRKVGRKSEALAIEAELWKLLSLADGDHPIRAALGRTESAAVGRPGPPRG